MPPFLRECELKYDAGSPLASHVFFNSSRTVRPDSTDRVPSVREN
jgi:hypothetical protein